MEARVGGGFDLKLGVYYLALGFEYGIVSGGWAGNFQFVGLTF